MDGHSKLNQVYKGMKQRCFNSNDKHYKNYGARGITICPEWLDSEEVKLMGGIIYQQHLKSLYEAGKPAEV